MLHRMPHQRNLQELQQHQMMHRRCSLVHLPWPLRQTERTLLQTRLLPLHPLRQRALHQLQSNRQKMPLEPRQTGTLRQRRLLPSHHQQLTQRVPHPLPQSSRWRMMTPQPLRTGTCLQFLLQRHLQILQTELAYPRFLAGFRQMLHQLHCQTRALLQMPRWQQQTGIPLLLLTQQLEAHQTRTARLQRQPCHSSHRLLRTPSRPRVGRWERLTMPARQRDSLRTDRHHQPRHPQCLQWTVLRVRFLTRRRDPLHQRDLRCLLMQLRLQLHQTSCCCCCFHQRGPKRCRRVLLRWHWPSLHSCPKRWRRRYFRWRLPWCRPHQFRQMWGEDRCCYRH